jgi:hypothetical protein
LLLALLKVGKRKLTAGSGSRTGKAYSRCGCLKEKESAEDTEFDSVLRHKHGIDLRTFLIRDDIPPPPWKLDKLFSRRKKNHQAIMATWNQRRSGGEHAMRDFSASAYEMALADYAACNKWTPQEICDLLVTWRYRHQLPTRNLHLKRVRATLRKAYRVAMERGLIRRRPGKTGPLRRHLSTLLDKPLQSPAIDIDRLALRFGVKRETVARTIRRLKTAVESKHYRGALRKAA